MIYFLDSTNNQVLFKLLENHKGDPPRIGEAVEYEEVRYRVVDVVVRFRNWTETVFLDHTDVLLQRQSTAPDAAIGDPPSTPKKRKTRAP